MYQAVFEIIADDLKNQILSGDFKYSGMLPSENKLCQQYHVSRTTIRRALEILQKNRLVVSIPGKGCAISLSEKEAFLFQFDTDRCIPGGEVETRLLGVDMIHPDLDLALKLQMNFEGWVIRIRKLLYAGAAPAGYDDRYIRYRFGIPSVENDINYTLYSDILSNQFPIRVMEWTLRISAEKAQPGQAEILEIEPDAPIAAVEQAICSETEGIVGWAKTIYRADCFEIKGNSMY